MNILIFADYGGSYEGNFISSLKTLEDKVTQNNGKLVYVFTPVAKQYEWTKKINNIYFLTGNFIKDIFLIRRIINDNDIQIVHTHFSTVKYDLILKQARIISKKTKYIRHMHMIYKNKSNILLEKVKKLISNADIELACGEACYKSMKQAGLCNVKLVTNAIDFKRLDEFDILDRKKEDRIVFVLGYDYHVKGIDLAIKSILSLQGEITNLYLYICSAINIGLVKTQIISEFGEIPQFVRFLEPRNDIATYYKYADVFLSSSREEGFCYALREAGYCGDILVASDIDAHLGIETAFYFKTEDYQDLAEKIKFAFNIQQREEMIAKQKENIYKEYSIESWSQKIYDIYCS